MAKSINFGKIKSQNTAHLLSDCGDQWKRVRFRHSAFGYDDREMAMAEAALLATITIDCPSTAAIRAIVIGVVEEPVDDAACVVADDASKIYDSNDAVTPDEWQPKEVVDEFGAKVCRKFFAVSSEPEFVEPDQRRRRGRGRIRRGGGYGAIDTVGESFEEAPKGGGASCNDRICRIRNTGHSSVLKHDFKQSAVKRMSILDQVVRHPGRIARCDAQSEAAAERVPIPEHVVEHADGKAR